MISQGDILKENNQYKGSLSEATVQHINSLSLLLLLLYLLRELDELSSAAQQIIR